MRPTRGIAATPVIAGLTLVAGLAAGLLVGRPRHTTITLDPVTTHGEWVKFANAKGDSIRAYVAYPERKDKAPTVIVIHEIFGMTDWEPTMADHFAAKGYIAVVPDLLSSRWGTSPASPDSGRKLVAQLTPDGVNADLDAAYRYINALPAASKDRTGVIGFCWGGGTVWRYASANPKLKAAVVCYGPLADTLLLKTIKAPVLGVFGENDMRVNAMIPLEQRILGDLKIPFSADSYPGTGHGFLKPGRKGSGTPEAERALGNIDAFFAKRLEGK
ncbi:MAG: dienelactone hydrolase family protein [Gemmatimonadota bacterium]